MYLLEFYLLPFSTARSLLFHHLYDVCSIGHSMSHTAGLGLDRHNLCGNLSVRTKAIALETHGESGVGYMICVLVFIGCIMVVQFH